MKTAKEILDYWLNGYFWQHWSKDNCLKAMEEYAKEYHESELKKMRIADVEKNEVEDYIFPIATDKRIKS